MLYFSSAHVTMVNLIGKQRSFLTHARIITTAHIIWFTSKFMTERDISVTRRFLWGEGGGLTQRLYIIYVWFYKLCFDNHVRISELTSSYVTGKIKSKTEKIFIFFYVFITFFFNIPMYWPSADVRGWLTLQQNLWYNCANKIFVLNFDLGRGAAAR